MNASANMQGAMGALALIGFALAFIGWGIASCHDEPDEIKVRRIGIAMAVAGVLHTLPGLFYLWSQALLS